jgi:hypothetical protein
LRKSQQTAVSWAEASSIISKLEHFNGFAIPELALGINEAVL